MTAPTCPGYDLILKLRILLMDLRYQRDPWRHWYREVWRRDLDGWDCCSGHECGCRGATLRDRLQWELTR